MRSRRRRWSSRDNKLGAGARSEAGMLPIRRSWSIPILSRLQGPFLNQVLYSIRPERMLGKTLKNNTESLTSLIESVHTLVEKDFNVVP